MPIRPLRHILKLALLLVALATPSAPCRAAIVVTYPQPESNDHAYRHLQPEHYPIRLLELALRRANPDYQLQPSAMKMTQGRVMLELQRGSAIDVMWTMTTAERERALLPVRIPIFKGLIGWRLLLIKRDQADTFARITRIDQLKALLALQGHDWPDTRILRANQFRVSTGAYYGTMFDMLSNRRVDYFPRSVIEIWNEAEANQEAGLIVEPTIALRYPAAFYFFVKRGNTRLAHDLAMGLDAMIADGSFDRLFHQYHDDMIRRARLSSRRIFELDNPLLPAATPLDRKALWFRQ